jgi:hypothetical protein
MSREKHDDNCRGCMPAVLDPKTGKVLPDTHWIMKAIYSVWNQTTLEEREAFHHVTIDNSRDPKEMELFTTLGTKFQEAMIFAEEQNECGYSSSNT